MKKEKLENQKSLEKKKFHKSCRTLPLRKLVNLQNSNIEGVGDNRHILVDYEWEENYQDAELSFYVDKILKEWQELTGGNFYNKMFDDFDTEKYNELRIEALNLMYIANTLKKFEVIKEIAEKFRFTNLKSQNDILQKTKQIEEKIKVNKEENKAKVKFIAYADLITDLKLHFPDVRFDTEITCEEYASWLNRIKAKNNG